MSQLARARRFLGRLAPKELAVKGTDRIFAEVVPPAIVIDLGAAYFPHGRWRLFQFAQQAQWLLIDPNGASLDYVEKWPHPSRARKLVAAVGGVPGQAYLYVTNTPTGSSLLRPEIPQSMRNRISPSGQEYFFPMKEVPVDLLTLNQALVDCGEELPRVLKMDTQGSEFHIAQSVQSWITSGLLVGVEMEASLLAQPLYDGMPRLSEVLTWFEQFGWEMLVLDVIESPPRGSLPNSNSYPHECDVVLAPRPDVADSWPLSSRRMLLCFYVANRLYGEAERILIRDPELGDALRDEGIDPEVLRSRLWKHLGGSWWMRKIDITQKF